MPSPADAAERPVLRAEAEGGVELPVIDITHPAFALDLDAGEMERRTEKFIAEQRRWARWPRWLLRPFMAWTMRKTVLGRALQQAEAGFLTGLYTYMMKLGPRNLEPPLFQDLDRQIAGSFPAMAMRLRLQDVAGLLAEALVPALEARPGVPLDLLNIAGGPAPDSLNALILLRRDHPGLVDGRPIGVHVFDLDTTGPAFAAKALAALTAAGGPLHGLAITLRHVAYDWREVDLLGREAAAIADRDGILAGSSEGGLFEYGSDEEVVANLDGLSRVLPPGAAFVGSVTRPDGIRPHLHVTSRVPTRPRTIEAFGALAARAGWTIDRVLPAPLSFNLRLRRM
jgi:hypothetical protein